MWLKCQAAKKQTLELPATLEGVLLFIDFLTTDRGLTGATVDCYLAGLRQLHVVRGMEPPGHLRGSLVKLVVKGKKNEDALKKRRGEGRRRVAVTENIMLLLKEKIRTADWGPADKLLCWVVCTTAFAGAFRIHEILCRLEATFDPDFELLTEDVVIRADSISFTLKCPKEQKLAAPTVVDVFANGGPLCPVNAFKKWQLVSCSEKGLPMFRWADGTPLTGKKFNDVLASLLDGEMDKKSHRVTTHSFRSGIASMMAARGFKEDDIKAIGRWSSRAYEVYVKHPRTRRAEMASALARKKE
jgi:hypothetical protein